MKTIIFYDTETTGLPLFKEPSEHPGQPHIVQLAAELCEEETGKTLGAMNLIIRPEGWVMSPEALETHGISEEYAASVGVPARAAMDTFLELWTNADVRCAHNETFDARLLRIAIMRCAYWSMEAMQTSAGEVAFADYWKQGESFCTQTNSTKILNLPPTEKMMAKRMTGPKSPNLGEAYYHFTGKVLDGAHDAQVDIMACKAVYYGIKKHHADALAAA